MNKTLKAILKSRCPKENNIKALIKKEFEGVKPYRVSRLRKSKLVHLVDLNFADVKRLS